ncbi:MAG: hypothetical protein ABSB40_02205 [Nitrososphaeria archaeon]|jgi:hypothetical protein
MQGFNGKDKTIRENNEINEHTGLLLNTSGRIRADLAKIITKAKRSGAWRKLEKMDRSLLLLSSKLEIRFKSMELLHAITRIVKEITELTSFVYRNYLLGIKSAYRISKYAVSCGYKEAALWSSDRSFAIYWGIFINPHTYTK